MLLVCPKDRRFKVTIPPAASPRHVTTLTSASACPQLKGLPHKEISVPQGLSVSFLWEPGCCGMTALPFPITSLCLEDTLGIAQKWMHQVLNPPPCNPRVVLKVEYESRMSLPCPWPFLSVGYSLSRFFTPVPPHLLIQAVPSVYVV